MTPTPQYWNGVLRWACPLCSYDDSAASVVQAHINVKHPGAVAPSAPQIQLSIVPQLLPPGDYPRITCIMVTKNRHEFAKQAAQMFEAQTYPNKELVIVDDSDIPFQAVPCSSDVKVRHTSPRSVGFKRNVACGLSSGQFIAVWDDDEWQSPNRLALQYSAFTDEVDLVGICRPIFGILETKELFIFNGRVPSSAWCSGSTIMFRKSVFDRQRFLDVNVGEDQAFIQGVSQRRIAQMPFVGFNVSFVHGSNTVTKDVTKPPYIKLSAAFPIID